MKLQTAGRYRSSVSRDLHEIAIGLHKNGAMPEGTLEEIALLTLKPAEPMTADEVRQVRLGSNLTQEVFGRALNVSKKTVSAWEQGLKKPSGPSLRLLDIVKRKGIVGVI